MERLDKLVSNMTGLSRREVHKVIADGGVTVNSSVMTKADYKVDAEKDIISVNGRELKYDKFVYYILNKPKGLLTASTDSRRETVLDLFQNEPRYGKLFAVGRLDKDTTGLLLITDDGEYAHKVISPKSRVEKEYRATLDAPLPEDAEQRFAEGIVLADGTKCLPAVLKRDKQDLNVAYITVYEGKYHQIKRMLGTLELGVEELHRIRIADLYVPEKLAQGEFCRIDKEEAYSVLTKGAKDE